MFYATDQTGTKRLKEFCFFLQKEVTAQIKKKKKLTKIFFQSCETINWHMICMLC